MLSRRTVYIPALLLIAVISSGKDAFSQAAQSQRRQMPLPTLNFPTDKTVIEVPFEVESGLMVIPVSINGSRPFRYGFDTGASGAIHFESAIADALNLKMGGEIQVRGAGGGGAMSTARIAENVNFRIAGIELLNGQLALRTSAGGLSGVIGRPIFANLVVEVDWEKQVIRFYDPAKFNYAGPGIVLPLTFDDGGRPYTTASVAVAGEKRTPVKLVVDSGASHALSLDVGSTPEIVLPEGAVKTVLGRGASGEVMGHSGRVSTIEFGGQTFKNVPTSFPDSSAGTAGLNGRHGNLGSGILRRFKVIYDYSRKQMILEPNKFSSHAFGTPMPTTPATSIQVAAVTLQEYVGRYGNKEISVRDNGLYYQRIGGRGAELRSTGKDKFALNTDAQITFVRDAKNVVTEMIIDWVERDREQLKREPLNSAPPTSQPVALAPRAVDDQTFAKELNTYLEQATTGDRFSGVVLIARNGQPVFKKAYGLANKDNSLANNIDTRFDLGSMNKMFTAVAIAQLAERGKLSLTDTVGKLLPDYPNKAVAEKVTVHHLLTHTSGMGSYFNDKFRANLNNLRTVSDYIPLFVDDPLAFEPGAKWQYSNSGFALLGLIIEKLSGQGYFDYVREHIFKPAGMSNTDSYERDKNNSNMAIGYTRMGENGRPDPSAPRRANTSMRPTKGSPAGGGYSTVEDMLRFSLALQSHKLLNKKYTELFTSGKVAMGQSGRKYGYGFGEEVSDGRRIIGHNGGGPGIGAHFDVFLELGYTVVVLGNYDPPAVMPVVAKIRELLSAVPASSAQTTPKQ